MNRDSSVSQRVQDAFVFLSITDVKFISMVREAIKPKYFSSRITEDIVKICYGYYDQFGAAPGNHLHDELVRFLDGKDDEIKRLYIEYLTKLQTIDPPNQDYVASRINEFVKAREFEDAAIKFVKLTKDGEFESAKQLMYDALKSGIQKAEIGTRYLEVEVPTYLIESGESNEYLIPLGIDALDKRLVRGIRRTDFVVVLGNFKGGKSWFCSHLGVEAFIKGLKVLHISHENSAEDVEMRYDMTFGALKSYGDSYASIEEIDDDGRQISKKIECVGSVFDSGAAMGVRKKIARFGGDLIIKKYPMGSCTIEEIIRYLDYLETYVGFIPDLVINDYVEKMRLSVGDSQRNEINNIYIRSKGIADERKLAMITVSQSTRNSQEREFLGVRDFAEDIRKLGDVDLAVGISRTKSQADENRMQALVLANRHGSMGFACRIANNFDIGQFCVKSWPIKIKEDDDSTRITSADFNQKDTGKPWVG